MFPIPTLDIILILHLLGLCDFDTDWHTIVECGDRTVYAYETFRQAVGLNFYYQYTQIAREFYFQNECCSTRVQWCRVEIYTSALLRAQFLQLTARVTFTNCIGLLILCCSALLQLLTDNNSASRLMYNVMCRPLVA